MWSVKFQTGNFKSDYTATVKLGQFLSIVTCGVESTCNKNLPEELEHLSLVSYVHVTAVSPVSDSSSTKRKAMKINNSDALSTYNENNILVYFVIIYHDQEHALWALYGNHKFWVPFCNDAIE